MGEGGESGGGGGANSAAAPPRDVRRYKCGFCDVVRSKKCLIRAHVLDHHKDEVDALGGCWESGDGGPRKELSRECEQCGMRFKKPAHLKQHMQSHSLEIWMCEALDPKELQNARRPLMDQYRDGETLLRSSIKSASFTLLFSIGSQRTPKCNKALNGLVSGSGDHPEKLHQKCLVHALLQKPFSCHVDGCPLSYSRKDHLNRHLLTHQGKLFVCPIEGCDRKFNIKGNMERHVQEIHKEDSPCGSKKEFTCPEVNCGKTFKYASKLKKHEESHVKLEYTEVICCEPGCMKYFSNMECLKAHNQSCHQHVQCDICGTKQLKKNFQRHRRMHEGFCVTERVKCHFEDCKCSFSKKSNLDKHVKAVHEQRRPFVCQFPGCRKRFSYKHVRDNHEKSSAHVHTEGDFVEADEQRPRSVGGRKRKPVSVESLMRKRVAAPDDGPAYVDGTEYLRWLLSG